MAMAQGTIVFGLGVNAAIVTATLEPLPEFELKFPETRPTQATILEFKVQPPVTIVSSAPLTPTRILVSAVMVIGLWLMLAGGLVYFFYRRSHNSNR